jgi:hypothetical protein
MGQSREWTDVRFRRQPPGTEIDQDLEFQRRIWKLQRVAWAVMALVVLAAVLGLLGPGVLGMATAGGRSSPLWLEYDHFGLVEVEDDVLAAARELQGLERLDQIKFAVLESSGAISIIPRTGTPS